MKHARACRAAILVILLSVAIASCGGDSSAGPTAPSPVPPLPPPPLQPVELAFEFSPTVFVETCGDHQVGDPGIFGIWQFFLTIRETGGGSLTITSFSFLGLDSSSSLLWRDDHDADDFRSFFNRCDLAQVDGSPGIPVRATVCASLCVWTNNGITTATQLAFSGIDGSNGNAREFATPVLSLPRPPGSTVAGSRPSLVGGGGSRPRDREE